MLACVVFRTQNKHQRASKGHLITPPPLKRSLYFSQLIVGRRMKRIVHARLKINYLSPAHFSDIYTLTETPNTIENIFKYTLDVTENKKAAHFIQLSMPRLL